MSEGRGLVGYGLLEQIVGHLFLEGGGQVALIVRWDLFEEGSGVDDVGVGGDGESFGDLGCDEDVAITLLEMIVFGLHAVGVFFLLGARLR